LIAGGTLAHPFADFLPSFWAEGIFRALVIKISSARFSFPAADSTVAAAVECGLIFINIDGAARRYCQITALQSGRESIERNRHGI